MDKNEIIKNIALRGKGDIYLGVVGAVRTGKSTFIKKMVETLILPNISDEYERARCMDEIPQSAQGKMIMTTEPKFVPNNAVKVKIDDFDCNIKLIDCVGFLIDKAEGANDDNGPRMVKSPWYSELIPFKEAAEIGTEKVIKEHATIGIVVTTDGSFGEFERDDYLEAEEKVITELKAINKPFIVILNTTHPNDSKTLELVKEISDKYQVVVLPVNVDSMTEHDMINILKEALYEFPIIEVKVKIPDWVSILTYNNPLKELYVNKIKESVFEIDKLRDVDNITNAFNDVPEIEKAYLSNVDPATGEVIVTLDAPVDLYNKTLYEIINIDINNKKDLLKLFQEYSIAKNEYDQVKYALKMVKQTGYGVANPTINDMKLATPEITKQGNRFGVKLKATAPSIHMIRVDVNSTFEPIIGTELQSKELIDYLMKDYEKDPSSIWKSEIFGRSLDAIVGEGIQSKISLMPENIRFKLQQTLTKIVNRGSNNLIAIVI